MLPQSRVFDDKRRRMRFWIGVLVVIWSCSAFSEQSAAKIEGAWEVQSIHWITPEETHDLEPAQPGLFLFVDTSYTVMWTRSKQPRTPFESLSKPTETEMIHAFQTVVFNGGRFAWRGDQLVLKPTIARVPGFEGGEQIFNVTRNNNRLTLTMVDETYPDGAKPDWFGKLETRFVLSKAE